MKKYEAGLEQHITLSFRSNVLCLLLAYCEFYWGIWALLLILSIHKNTLAMIVRGNPLWVIGLNTLRKVCLIFSCTLLYIGVPLNCFFCGKSLLLCSKVPTFASAF